MAMFRLCQISAKSKFWRNECKDDIRTLFIFMVNIVARWMNQIMTVITQVWRLVCADPLWADC